MRDHVRICGSPGRATDRGDPAWQNQGGQTTGFLFHKMAATESQRPTLLS